MTSPLALSFGQPGLPEILLILFVVLLLFGSKKLPDLARSIGRSLSEFKKGREDGTKAASELTEGEDGDDTKKA